MEIKKKCPSCGRKIERKFNFCPWCGRVLKNKKRNDYGFLGKDDFSEGGNQMTQGIMPMGNLNKIMNSLMNQINKEMQNFDGKDFSGSMPKGFSIKIQRGMPQIKQPTRKQPKEAEKIIKPKLSEKEKTRRSNLKSKNTTSKVRRLSDKIFYEIDAPGIKDKSQVEITSLENGLEVKIYTKEFCYVKLIPVKIKFSKMDIKKDKLILEFKN